MSLFREDGKIAIAFIENEYLRTKASDSDIPDTNKFILKVSDSKGKVLYDGEYGSAPESIIASPGTYTVCALSKEFSSPAFSSPQFGDTQSITVKSGETAAVSLSCRMMNSGIKLKVSSDFLTSYPQGTLHLKSDSGKLMYSFSEKRFAYFPVGKVSLIMSEGATDKTLLTRTTGAGDMLTLNIAVAQKSTAKDDGRISIQIDTSRNWLTEDFTIGGNAGKGDNIETAMGVGEARNSVGKKGVWVYGYIVGGDLSSSKASFNGPFTSRTNLVIAAKKTTNDKDACLSVQLLKGEIRDALNLVDNPGNLGKIVFLKGDIVESYYGIPGIQELSDCKLE